MSELRSFKEIQAAVQRGNPPDHIKWQEVLHIDYDSFKDPRTGQYIDPESGTPLIEYDPTLTKEKLDAFVRKMHHDFDRLASSPEGQKWFRDLLANPLRHQKTAITITSAFDPGYDALTDTIELNLEPFPLELFLENPENASPELITRIRNEDIIFKTLHEGDHAVNLYPYKQGQKSGTKVKGCYEWAADNRANAWHRHLDLPERIAYKPIGRTIKLANEGLLTAFKESIGSGVVENSGCGSLTLDEAIKRFKDTLTTYEEETGQKLNVSDIDIKRFMQHQKLNLKPSELPPTLRR